MTAPVTTNAEAARNALRQVKDPELDMNIIDLGLVYDVEIVEGEVRVKMTLTSPGCPAGPMITNDAYRVLRGLEGVKDVDIEIVWEPYWTPERMEDRKSTRLNSSHGYISYAVFCLKKKNQKSASSIVTTSRTTQSP